MQSERKLLFMKKIVSCLLSAAFLLSLITIGRQH